VAAFEAVMRLTQDTEEASVEQEADADELRRRAAAILGSLGGKKGGPARAKALTKTRRSEIAKKAAKARWKRKKRK
jgi:hypothetical protein